MRAVLVPGPQGYQFADERTGEIIQNLVVTDIQIYRGAPELVSGSDVFVGSQREVKIEVRMEHGDFKSEPPVGGQGTHGKVRFR